MYFCNVSLRLFPPFRAEAAQARAIHFIAGVLGELDVQMLFVQAEDLSAVAAQRPGKLESKFGRPAAPDIAHQHRYGRRLSIDHAPHAAFAKLALDAVATGKRAVETIYL